MATFPASTSSPAVGRRHALIFIRLAGLLALGVVFFTRDDLVERTLGLIAELRASWLVLGLALYVCGLFVAALRVQILAAAAGHVVPYRSLIAAGIKATGLSASLAMGAGDVYRVARLRAAGIGLLEASGIVVADRGIGMAFVAAAGLIGLAIFGRELTGFSIPVVHAVAAALCVCALAFVVGRRAVIRWLPRALPFFDQPRRTAAVLISSTFILALWIASIVSFARSLGLDVGVGALASAASLVTVATLLPISIGGVGIREAGYVLLLAPYGVTSSEAVALGLVQYGGMIVVALIAWIGFLLEQSGEFRPGARNDAGER